MGEGRDSAREAYVSADRPRNGHDHGMVDDDRDRDWIGEAARMVAVPRQTMMLPEYGHVEALYNELVPLQKIVALQNRALISLLLHLKQSSFQVLPLAIREIEHKQLDLMVQHDREGGPIVVTLVRQAPSKG